MPRGFQAAAAALYERRIISAAVMDRGTDQNRSLIPP